MASPANWNKILDDKNHQTGGNVYADVQRWRHSSGNIIVEVIMDSRESKGEQARSGGEITLINANDFNTPIDRAITNGVGRSHSETRELLRKDAVSWMKDHPKPSAEQIENSSLLDYLNNYSRISYHRS